jgi:hypothetical protein
LASIASELGVCVSVAGADLLFLVQPASLQLELANSGRLQRLFLARLVEYSQDILARSGIKHSDGHDCGLGEEIRFSRVTGREPAVRGACPGYAIAGADYFRFLRGSGCFTLSRPVYRWALDIISILRGVYQRNHPRRNRECRDLPAGVCASYWPDQVPDLQVCDSSAGDPGYSAGARRHVRQSDQGFVTLVRDFDRGIYLERTAGFRFNV